jgi:hypothetical protein
MRVLYIEGVAIHGGSPACSPFGNTHNTSERRKAYEIRRYDPQNTRQLLPLKHEVGGSSPSPPICE